MKNVKLGFQFGIGLGLAKIVLSLPIGLRDPRVRRELDKLMDVIKGESKDPEPNMEPQEETRKTSAFPQCKNTIGF